MENWVLQWHDQFFEGIALVVYDIATEEIHGHNECLPQTIEFAEWALREISL